MLLNTLSYSKEHSEKDLALGFNWTVEFPLLSPSPMTIMQDQSSLTFLIKNDLNPCLPLEWQVKEDARISKTKEGKEFTDFSC